MTDNCVCDTRERLEQLFQDPKLRLADVPGIQHLRNTLLLHPDDQHLREILEIIVQQQRIRATSQQDPFWQNYPPAEQLQARNRDWMPLLGVPTGGLLSQPVRSATKNIIYTGRSGLGKTNALRVAVTGIAASSVPSTVVLFDRKGDFSDTQTIARDLGNVVVLRSHELPLAPLQPPPHVARQAYANTFVSTFSSHLNLEASRRLLLESLNQLYAKAREKGAWPTWNQWIQALEGMKAHGASNLGRYRESALYALKSVGHSFGNNINYAHSSLLEDIFNTRGVVVIRTDDLDARMASFLAGVIINWTYEARGALEVSGDAPLVVFALDDALPLVTGGHASESEGGINPLATWAFMGRSRGMGFIVSAQNYSLISPALRNNTNTVVCCGSHGRDAHELQIELNLDRPQKELLSRMQPGEGIALARDVWPLPVYGRIPLLP